MSEAAAIQPQVALVRRGRRLECLTILWNSAEGVIGVAAGRLHSLRESRLTTSICNRLAGIRIVPGGLGW